MISLRVSHAAHTVDAHRADDGAVRQLFFGRDARALHREHGRVPGRQLAEASVQRDPAERQPD